VANEYRITQEPADVVVAPDPDARVTSVSPDVAVGPTTAAGRISTDNAEVGVRPSNPPARTSQLSIEAIIQLVDSDLRMSQLTVEVIHRNLLRETFAVSIAD
jgi:hypothetical protein